MADDILSAMTPARLVVMGDGLARAGDTANATLLYRAALERGPDTELANRIRLRLGLAIKADRRLKATYDITEAVESIGTRNWFVGDGLAVWLKTQPFLEDPRFMALSEQHDHLLPVRNWHWNLTVALWAVARARALPGDLVELGVFKGHTTVFCADYVRFAEWDKRWWLYDTFEGIPEDQLDPGWAKINAELYGTNLYAEVRERFARFPNIDVIQGRVPEILHERPPGQIAFLHVDMNNASAEIAALDLLFDRVVPGGVILFDDYAWGTSRAQYDAEKSWFERRGEMVLPLPTGQGLYVKR
ncbi:MAG: class I SAM-dependent methyltransferase [Phenylobacterium sp.]|uniref:TylF/MycF/NovP-related O-methyltransferase n=1 Tax=Phenylobacterium sp. TaxID=1871053 RepID=UPI001A5C0E52|nr:TylF/MycF/NovP-related O-methyltransferase [Phenylobacterium sp.]MBL8555368.1 class I SAM-dependent methyltransferase [Phenylobacterium sp.]